jgi:hypothetical protein
VQGVLGKQAQVHHLLTGYLVLTVFFLLLLQMAVVVEVKLQELVWLVVLGVELEQVLQQEEMEIPQPLPQVKVIMAVLEVLQMQQQTPAEEGVVLEVMALRGQTPLVEMVELQPLPQ